MGGILSGGNTLSVVRVSAGTLMGLRDKILRIRNQITRRNIEGWVLFQQDEEWNYETKRDGRECPVCSGFEGFPITGDNIPTRFPVWVWRDEQNRVIHPRTHEQPNFPTDIFLRDGGVDYGCGCSIMWSNYPSILTERLTNELQQEADT